MWFDVYHEEFARRSHRYEVDNQFSSFRTHEAEGLTSKPFHIRINFQSFG